MTSRGPAFNYPLLDRPPQNVVASVGTEVATFEWDPHPGAEGGYAVCLVESEVGEVDFSVVEETSVTFDQVTGVLWFQVAPVLSGGVVGSPSMVTAALPGSK